MTQTASTSWWSRNWKWFVPVCCLLGLASLGGFIAAIWFGITGIMKSSDSYKMALAVAQDHPQVIAALGEPIEVGSFVMGQIHVSGPSGYSSLQIPLSGPKGNATLYLEAKKSLGEWGILLLVLEVASTKERIVLVENPTWQPQRNENIERE